MTEDMFLFALFKGAALGFMDVVSTMTVVTSDLDTVCCAALTLVVNTAVNGTTDLVFHFLSPP